MTPIREQINFWLRYYGIQEDFEIEVEAEEGILNLLQSEQLESLTVEGNELVFEFSEEEEQEC